MRIVAGDFRGRTIKIPPASITRPTTDRVREALMSSLYSQMGSFEGCNVLDAFAGSGALGIEALSRGAAKVTFCECNGQALKVLQGNIAQFPEIKRRCLVKRGDVLKRPPTVGAPFDLVFLDPPYATDPVLVAQLLMTLDAAGMLAQGAHVYYEHAKSLVLAECSAIQQLQWETVASKSYGDIAFDILRKG